MLVRRKDGVNGWGYAFANGSGDYSIVSVVDHQWSCIFNKKCRLFWKDIEQATVERRWGRIAVHKAVNAGKDNRSSNVRSDPVDFERNVVGTHSRVIGVGNYSVDKGFGDFRRSTFNNLVVDAEKSIRIASGSMNPFVLPEISQQRVYPGRVIGYTVISVFKGGDRFLTRRERTTNDSELIQGDPGVSIVGIGCKLSVDVIEEGSGVTIFRDKRVYLVVNRVALNDELTIELTLRIRGVENVHSIPKALVWCDFSGRKSTKLCMSFGEDRLKLC
jgi:hypothetical protein